MTRSRLIATGAALIGGMLVLTAAQQPLPLALSSPGDWEITGAPGAKAPLRQCFADVSALAQFEHRGRHCTSKLIREQGSSMVIQYNCGVGDFGRTQVDVLTPRSLRISTQGISQSLPFNYVLQARRVGECAKTSASSRH